MELIIAGGLLAGWIYNGFKIRNIAGHIKALKEYRA